MSQQRRIGQETEYAVRRPGASNYHASSTKKPSNHSLFLLIRGFISDNCRCLPGYRDYYQSQFFAENGSAFAYEALPTAEKDGLIEGATAECSTPHELLCQQRAQEAWLKKALASHQVQADQAFQGCGLLKNCRDAEGHIYGSQENYEAEIGSPFWLLLYRAVICLAVPVTFLATIAIIAVALCILFSIGLIGLFSGGVSFIFSLLARMLPVKPLSHISQTLSGLNERAIANVTSIDEEQASKLANATLFPILFILLSPIAWLVSQITFRKVRRGITGFLITRSIISGAGSLISEGNFVLSEKGSALLSIKRNWATMASRSIFDSGNLLKGVHLAALDCFVMRRHNWLFLLNRKQRIQIGCSDANRCDVSEYLKIGTTQLVIEMAESGHLKKAPYPRSTIAAATAINQDPSLKAQVKTRGGRLATAITIQRWYQKQAQIFVALDPVSRAHFQPLIDRWKQVIDTLEWDPEQLIGQVDWITKKSLLEGSGAGQSFTIKKRIDLGYHELGSGYFEHFANANLVTRLVTDEEIEQALTQAPSTRSAQLRSRFIRSNHSATKPWIIAWDYATTGLFRNQSRRVFNRTS